MTDYSGWIDPGVAPDFITVSQSSRFGQQNTVALEFYEIDQPARGTAVFPIPAGAIGPSFSPLYLGASAASNLRFATYIDPAPDDDDPNTAHLSLGIADVSVTTAHLASSQPASPVDMGLVPPSWDLGAGTVTVEYETTYAGIVEAKIIATGRVKDQTQSGGLGPYLDATGRVYWANNTLAVDGSGWIIYPGDIWRGWAFTEFPEGDFSLEVPITPDVPVTLFPAGQGVVESWIQSPMSLEPTGWTSYGAFTQLSGLTAQARYNYSPYRFVYEPTPPPTPTRFGSWNLRQRQDRSGSDGGWSLRQRQHGGADASWPLRQR